MSDSTLAPKGPSGMTDGPRSSDAVQGSARTTIAWVLVAAIGLYIMVMTLSTALSLRLASLDATGATTVYSNIVAVAAFFMLVTVPLGGALSDRTTSRFGRRRPWILGMLVPTLLAMAVIGTTTSTVVIGIAYVVGLNCAQVGFNAYSVIAVEGVPDAMRARVMGLMGLFGALALSAGSAIASRLVAAPLLMMTVPVLLAFVTAAPLLLFYRDPVRHKDEVPPLNLTAMARGMFVNPRKHPDFGWAWISRLLAGIAMSALFSFFVLFMITNLHLAPADAGAKASALSLASAPISVLFFTGSGWISDKIGRRKPLVFVAALIMAASLLIAATSTTYTQFLVAWLVFAVGQAMYLTVDLALCAAVLPNAGDAGKDMAVFGLALNIPNIIVPAAAPTILAIGAGNNYLVLWTLAAVLCALGAAAVLRVKGVR